MSSQKTIQNKNKIVLDIYSSMHRERPTHSFTKDGSASKPTRGCKYVRKQSDGTFSKCKSSECTYAHTMEELHVPECDYGDDCNRYPDCKYLHSDSESLAEFYFRTGQEAPILPSKVQPVKQTQVKAPVVKPPTKSTTKPEVPTLGKVHVRNYSEQPKRIDLKVTVKSVPAIPSVPVISSVPTIPSLAEPQLATSSTVLNPNDTIPEYLTPMTITSSRATAVKDLGLALLLGRPFVLEVLH